MMRTHEAGTLREEHVGQTVTLAGWVARRRDHGGVAFLDLRDRSGVVQVVLHEGAGELRAEYCVQVTGTVGKRPAGNENAELPTGAIEIAVTSLEVLSPAAALPFQLDEPTIGEETRLKYRYLDLRRPAPAAAMALRSEVNHAARTVLHDQGFLEIETPTLTRSTPEGARDFLVPARLQARLLVRPAAVAAAVQAAADGQRHGEVLPDRPLLPRRGLPRRPAAGVHPARRRDELRRPGRRDRDGRVGAAGAVVADRPHHRRDPADHLRRRDAPLRLGQARPAVRPRAGRDDRLLHGHAVPGVPGPLRRRCRHARRGVAAAQAARRLAGVGQAARRQGPGLRAVPGGRDHHRSGRQEPVRDRARRPGRGGRAPRRATACSSPPARPETPARCSVRPATRSPAGWS